MQHLVGRLITAARNEQARSILTLDFGNSFFNSGILWKLSKLQREYFLQKLKDTQTFNFYKIES